MVGMPRNMTVFEQLPNLKLIQSSHYMHLGRSRMICCVCAQPQLLAGGKPRYPRLSTVPVKAAVAKYDVPWHSYGVEPIAEFVIAAAFQWTLGNGEGE